jgi:hypothetical protein
VERIGGFCEAAFQLHPQHDKLNRGLTARSDQNQAPRPLRIETGQYPEPLGTKRYQRTALPAQPRLHAGMKLDVKTASADASDAVKGKAGRFCPLTCEPGYRVDGDRCVKITCRAGAMNKLLHIGSQPSCVASKLRGHLLPDRATAGGFVLAAPVTSRPALAAYQTGADKMSYGTIVDPRVFVGVRAPWGPTARSRSCLGRIPRPSEDAVSIGWLS